MEKEKTSLKNAIHEKDTRNNTLEYARADSKERLRKNYINNKDLKSEKDELERSSREKDTRLEALVNEKAAPERSS